MSGISGHTLGLQVEDGIMEMAELVAPLQWFCKHVTKHILCRAIFHCKLLCQDVVHHKEISDIDVVGMATTRRHIPVH
jgi:hypothetical protein